MSHAPNADAIRSSRSLVLTKAVLRAADRLGLTARSLGRVVGISEATVSRLKRGETALDPGTKPFELAALLVRAFRSLDAVTGGDEAVARAWMVAPNTALDGIPAERILSIQGLVDVTAYLDARRAPL